MCYELWRQQRKAQEAERARRETDTAIEKARRAKPQPVPERERRTDRREPATN